MTTYHIALTPLVVFGITGLLLALIPQWSVTRSRRDRWPMFGVLSILLAMSGLLFGYLAAYTPDGVAVLGAIIALSSCALGLVLGLAALACRERHRWLSLLGIVLSIVGSLRYFTPA